MFYRIIDNMGNTIRQGYESEKAANRAKAILEESFASMGVYRGLQVVPV